MIPLTSKVVLDPAAARTLLALAFNEGLLIDSPNNDKLLESIASRQYPKWLITQALEQIVLFEQIHIPLFLSENSIKGPLADSGPFHFFKGEENPTGEIQKIDPTILNGLLKARGISPTPFEDPSIIAQANHAFKQLQDWKEKHKEEPPEPLQIIIDQALNRTAEPEQRYRELKIIRQPLEALQPIAQAVDEYIKLVSAAQNRAAFVMTPIYDIHNEQLFQPEISKNTQNTPTLLLRLTSAKLGILPFGQSLKDTLNLAHDSATVALRVKIQEWTESLTEDSGSDTERIQKEIAHALSSLSKGNLGAKISNITTYIGIPIGLLSLVTSFAVAMGWTATIAGTAALITSEAIKKKHHWASFGSSAK